MTNDALRKEIRKLADNYAWAADEHGNISEAEKCLDAITSLCERFAAEAVKEALSTQTLYQKDDIVPWQLQSRYLEDGQWCWVNSFGDTPQLAVEDMKDRLDYEDEQAQRWKRERGG
jgi:hypothetical protein